MGIAGTTGGALVDGPTCNPAKYGLLSVAEVEDRSDIQGHWLTGVLADIDACDELTIHTACPTTPMPDKSEDATSFTTHHGDPFFLVSAFKCGTGGITASRAREIVTRRLNRGENRGIERAFWNGVDIAGNSIGESLGHNTDVVDITPIAGALSIASGVATLESAMGDCYPCTAVLHANRGVATYLSERNLLAPDGATQRLKATGSALVVGGGYGINGPSGNAAETPSAGEGWMYATGAIKVIRGPAGYVPDNASDPSMVDRAINDYQVFAERPYAILLDCCIFAVRVLTTSCC